MSRHALTDLDISRIWEQFRRGKSVETIAKDEGIKAERAENIGNAILEVFEGDVPLMIADRRAGMTKTQIADKYGYSIVAVRYYLHGVGQGEPEQEGRRMTFAEEWEAVCRKLNPKAWEGRNDDAERDH